MTQQCKVGQQQDNYTEQDQSPKYWRERAKAGVLLQESDDLEKEFLLNMNMTQAIITKYNLCAFLELKHKSTCPVEGTVAEW